MSDTPNIELKEIPEILTLQQVMEYLQISDSTIRRIIRAKKIKYFKVGKDYRFTKQDIEEFINQNRE